MNEFDKYQDWTRTTAIYPQDVSLFGTLTVGLIYCALKLPGEAGEVAEKIGKAVRDLNGIIDEPARQAILSELGDVQWYVARLAAELQSSLSEVIEMNIEKLESRKQREALGGSGDSR